MAIKSAVLRPLSPHITREFDPVGEGAAEIGIVGAVGALRPKRGVLSSPAKFRAA